MEQKVREILDKVNDAIFYDERGFVDINDTDISENNALHVVAIWGDVEAARVLVNGGININQKGEDDYTPLHEATLQNNEAMVEYLLSNGADASIRSTDNKTPQDTAVLMEYTNLYKIFEKYS